MVQIATANTARDGTGTIGTLLTGQTNGTRVEGIHIRATGTTTAGVIRLFIDNTTNVRLFEEYLVTAITPSTTVVSYTKTVLFDLPIVVPNTWILKVSTHNAETFNVFAFGGDF